MKTKKCRNCKVEFEPRNSTQIICSMKCAIELSKANVLKSNKVKQMKEKAAMKERIKTLSDYKNELQVHINKIVRLIDEGCDCCTCSKPPKKINAGHFLSRGSAPHLRFHLFNIWLQCEYCNTYKHGNQSLFSSFLHDFHVCDFVHDESLKWRHFIPDKVELKEYIIRSKAIIKALTEINKSVSLPRNIDDRIELRKKCNTLLNIYK